MRRTLTLWFIAGVLLVSVAGLVLTYLLIGHQLMSGLRDDLVAEVSRYTEVLAEAQTTRELADRTTEYLSSSASEPLRLHGMVLAIVTEDGLVRSNAGELRLEDVSRGRLPLERGISVLEEVETPQGHYLLGAVPIVRDDEAIAVAQVAAPLAPIRNTQRSFLGVLVLMAVVGALVIGFAFWMAVGKALEPVRSITRTAAGISRRDLSRRIPYEGPDDEIGELAETMNAMLSRLEDAFLAQDRFVSDVSHELRTPLTIAKGHLQVLDRQPELDPEAVREEHAVVLEELDRLNRLVADLLTLARANRQDFLQPDSVDLDALLRNLARQGNHLGARRWIIDELPGGQVEADQDRLTQVFLNLMQNAVQHTQPGGVIALGGRRTQGWVELWVRDEGAGMAPEVMERVFDRFYRASDAQSRTAGLGLGLAIARGIVLAHGGDLRAESTPGAGTRFGIWLPTTPQQAAAAQPGLPKSRGSHLRSLSPFSNPRQR